MLSQRPHLPTTRPSPARAKFASSESNTTCHRDPLPIREQRFGQGTEEVAASALTSPVSTAIRTDRPVSPQSAAAKASWALRAAVTASPTVAKAAHTPSLPG